MVTPNKTRTGCTDVSVKPKSHQYFSLQIQSGAKSPVKRCLLNLAVIMKMAEIKQGIIRNDSIWDNLIFKKVQVRYSRCKYQVNHVELEDLMASISLVGNHGWKSTYNGNRRSSYISLCPDIS